MKAKQLVLSCVLGLFAVASVAPPAQAGNPIESISFTYQGRLTDSAGEPVSGMYDMRFTLFDALVGGNQLGMPQQVDGVMVQDGLFTCMPSFFDVFFDIEVVPYMEIKVRPQGLASFDMLSPRQPLTVAPRSLISQNADGALGIFRVQPQPEPPGPMPGPLQARIVFGNNPDNICSIGIDPTSGGGSGLSGLLLQDPGGTRILRPPPPLFPPGPTRLLFGRTDDCTIGIDTEMVGLVLRDPGGIRGINPNPMGPVRLIFGPTDDCSIGIDPSGPGGLLLYDPVGARICPPPFFPPLPSRLLFGPTDDCTIGIDPSMSGLVLRDPAGIRAINPNPFGSTRILFGPTDDCSISIETEMTGLVLRDPAGIRAINPNPFGPMRLIFGPTDDCSIMVNPAAAGMVQGLLLYDPSGVRVCNPIPGGQMRLLFGPTDDCSIAVNPSSPGMLLRDPSGFRFLGGPISVNLPGPPQFGIHLPGSPAIPQNQGFANAWINASSRRWKENIQPIDNPLELISRLQGVSYDWKADHGGKHDIGFIAEDVAPVLPELVAWETDGQSAAGLNYDHIVALAIEGIKAQQKQIEELKAQNAAMQQTLASLQKQLAVLSQERETRMADAARRSR